VNLYETPDAFVIEADLPGVREEMSQGKWKTATWCCRVAISGATPQRRPVLYDGTLVGSLHAPNETSRVRRKGRHPGRIQRWCAAVILPKVKQK